MSTAASSSSRLQALRELMKERNLAAYIVPSEDEHSSEYLSPYDELRPWITGFTGSAGTAVIEADKASLFTDGRYWLQASKQLSSDWTLFKLGLAETPTHLQYLATLPAGSKIGVSARLIPLLDYNDLLSRGLSIEGTDDLVSQLWDAEGDRPARHAGEIRVLANEFTGRGVGDKLHELRESLQKSGHAGMVFSLLDEIAWLFNLRGSDIAFNPVFFAYALVLPETAILFLPSTHLDALTADVREHLVRESVRVEDINSVWSRLGELRFGVLKKGSKKLLGGLKTSLAIAQAVGIDSIELLRSPVTDSKAIKNEVELQGFRDSHIRDGVALVRYFSWLEEQLKSGAQMNEFDVASKLESFRAVGDRFQGLSFTTISSTGANAAIVHYDPPSTGSATVDKDQIYLCDSGAQYSDGTTDVTRTLHFGKPSAFEIEAFTRVLQGHIAIDTSVFPAGTTGYLLDVLARRPLWEAGLNYQHGTGHGVGHFLNVHEGPHGIGTRIAYNDTPLKPGMIISNEPGYYEDGKFGIRIESLVIVKEASTAHNFGGKGYLGFEHITICPIQTSLVDLELLTPRERAWLNNYNAECKQKLEGLLAGPEDDKAKSWLERECSPV